MAANNDETHLIRVLNINDVLLGRGGPSKFIGNVRFRDLVDSKRDEYVSYDSYNEKKRIATRGVHDVITARGGRFLRLVRIEHTPGEPAKSAIEGGVWEVAPRKVAIEKCKQALREKDTKPRDPERARAAHEEENGDIYYESNQLSEALGPPQLAAATLPVQPQPVELAPPNASSSNVLHASLLASRSASLASDPRLFLCQQSLLSFQLQSLIPQQQQHQQQLASVYPLQLSLLNLQNEQFLQNEILQSQLQTMIRQTAATNHSFDSDTVRQQQEMRSEQHNSDSASASSTASESDVRQDAVLALSALAIANHPKFTEEEEQIEQSQMSSDERVAALCDLFGKFTLEGTPPSKKAKRDLDRGSLDFLLAQMRLELELIPSNQKQAFMEAQTKCRPEEFSDERLERFLRCEGMHTKLAAQRFVNYWTGRREVFGQDKYLLSMTLSEALRDDITALEAGVYRILPHRDSSGRQLIIVEARRNTGDGYTPESMLRAVWYTIEAAAQDCTDISSGFVYIAYNKGSSIWDIGDKLYGRISHYEKMCWPMKFIGAHVCGSTSIVFRIIKPLIRALTDKRGRSRMVIHDVPDNELLEALSTYGIEQSMLPSEMGGSVVLDQVEWIESRHAVELEEI